MWNKVIVSAVLLAFVGLQLANSLRCYSSNSLAQEECNNVTANASTTWLKKYHNNVTETAGNNRFGCMNMTYIYSRNNVVLGREEHLGCYHEQIAVCNLKVNFSTPGTLTKYCYTCNTDLCTRNPAGTLSRSAYTIFTTVIAVILARVFYK